MTPNKEDYLKEIYKFGGISGLVPNKRISDALGISPASVTEMLGKLKREGLIFYEPYKGTRLTDEGISAAVSLVRGHRLWEVFLMRHLGYSWSEAHEDAGLLEHITPDRLTERLDRFLNHPAYCPHGSEIPQADGCIETANTVTLDLLPDGAVSVIRRVEEEKELLDYLQDAGVKIGASVRVIERAPYEGPLTLELDGRKIQVSHKAACRIYADSKD